MSDFDKEIAEIYKDMELKMIESMKRNLGLHLAEEVEAGIDYPQWQAIKIRELRKYQRHNKMLLKNSTRGMAKDIKDHIRDEMKQGSLHEMKRFKEAKDAGYKSAVAMKDGFFKINTRKVDALINSVNSDFSRADKAVLRMMNDTYRSTIFKYGMYVTNGVYTEKQAYDAAVKDFLSRGINCIEYKDGRRVNIADYTSMAIRTVNQRAYMAGEGEFRKYLGETLVIISSHATSCKLCRPFENKVLIDDVYSGGTPDDGDYMLLSQAMAEGLFHPRCRHGLGTYYPELEDIVHYETEDNKLNEYGTEELNRAHIENMIQKYKRLTVGSIDPDNIAKYQARLNEWEGRKAQLSIANSENSGIINAASQSNYYDRVVPNPEAKFNVKIDGYDNVVNNGLSKACKTVADVGFKNDCEILRLVNLDTGAIEYEEIGTSESVGNESFWKFASQNSKKRYAFVHNHNTMSGFSETDMRTLLSDNCIEMFVVSRADGTIMIVEKNKTPETLFFDKLYADKLEQINKKSRTGEISPGERTFLREKTIVDNLIKEYTKGLIIFE
nr:MAG TPA: minor capsid protein [Caudoviricetes sp.]